MKRGFKAHAENLATELRFETGTPLRGAFDPFAFSSMYGIPVVKLSELEGPERDYLLGSGNDVFSGMLIPNRAGVVILINDSHSIQRQRATFCHEIAHFVLEHPFEISFSADRSCGLGGEYEEEAV